ncbi:MAG: guanylate kinase [Pseudomonadota bacterium]
MVAPEHVTAGARRGLMLVLSSPSGAGKTTLSRSLMETDNSLTLSISATTRPRRPSEADGVHYFFKSAREFLSMRDAGEMLEWAEVHGNYYGTPRAPVEAALDEGRDVLFDIDWQGTGQIRKAMPDDLVSIFILPPSAEELENRLRRRAEDDDAVIDRRLKNAALEVAHWNEYDHIIVNRDFGASLDVIRSILASSRLERPRQRDLAGFVDGLIADLNAR